MECCYPSGCGEYAVTPVLVATSCPTKHCEEPACYPCLPRCSKPAYYCCEKKPKSSHNHDDDCCYTATPARCCVRHADPCTTAPCCHPPCKPVKTKYIMPCYRYEDGRITNQPTVLMRRACEVACGKRPRRKPFIVSTYAADPDDEVRRFHSEDARGNCCYHFERHKPDKTCDPYVPCQPCVLSPECQYRDAAFAHPIDPCCYYCR